MIQIYFFVSSSIIFSIIVSVIISITTSWTPRSSSINFPFSTWSSRTSIAISISRRCSRSIPSWRRPRWSLVSSRRRVLSSSWWRPWSSNRWAWFSRRWSRLWWSWSRSYSIFSLFFTHLIFISSSISFGMDILTSGFLIIFFARNTF